MDSHVKIQIVSRDLPLVSAFGSATYMLDFIAYLRKVNFSIEFLLLNTAPGEQIPWYIIPSPISRLAKVSAMNNFRMDHVLFNRSFSSWLEYIRWIINSRLPKSILPEWWTQWFRSIRKSLFGLGGHDSPDGKICPDSWDDFPISGELDFVRKKVSESKPDVIILERMWLGNIFDAVPNNAHTIKVFLAHDIVHQRVADFKKSGLPSYLLSWNKEAEAEQLRKAHVLLAIHDEDASILKEMAPHCEVICMPVSAVIRTSKTRQVPGRSLFVGSNVNHNITGLKWFLENVWPIVLKKSPRSTLHVCGTVCDAIQGEFEKVCFLGQVNDLTPEYGAAKICLAPLLVGSGLKIKLVEALAHQRACVSTSSGIQGLNELKGKAIIVADTAENFAESICSILMHHYKRLSMEAHARKYVEEKLNPAAVYQPFVDRIRKRLHL